MRKDLSICCGAGSGGGGGGEGDGAGDGRKKLAKKAMPDAYSPPKGYLLLDEVHSTLGNKPLRKLLGKLALAASPH